jgi:sulfite reductase (ferredoxin)
MSDSKRSHVEDIKVASQALRGALAAELQRDTDHFVEDDTVVLKHHGIYQQDDRDARARARGTDAGKIYSFMVRCKIPGGGLTGAQYLALDDVATRYADGTVRITTRQDIQFHGVFKRTLREGMQAINRALVTTLGACGDVVRNFMACPAPLADRARARIQEHALALTERLLPRGRAYHEVWLDGERVDPAPDGPEEPFYGATYLPRKFKVGLAFPGDNCVDVFSQDVGIVPVLAGDAVEGFVILVGGGLGKTHNKAETYPRLADPLATVEPDALGAVVEAIVTVQRDHGNRANRRRARLKYLIDEWGLPRFREAVEAQLGRSLAPPAPLAWPATDDHLGWHRQPDGRWFLGVWVENGRVKDTPEARTRSAFQALLARLPVNVRLTPQQNILFTDVGAAARGEVDAILRDHGVALAESLPLARRHAMACPAIPTCGLAVAEAERVFPDVVRQVEGVLRDLGLAEERLSLRMSGCPNGCSRPYIGDIGFVGRTLNKYQVYLGGDFAGTRLNVLYADMVPLDRLAETVRPLLAAFAARRSPREGFGDFCHRLGVEELRRLAAPAAAVAP